MSKDFILILSLALVVVLAWISLDVYQAFTKTKPPVVTSRDLRPLDPQFDMDVLRDIGRRVDKR
jgi:hypothetical protein